MNQRVYIGNLPWDTTEEDVLALCKPFGKIRKISLVPKSKACVAFVQFATNRQAEEAIYQLDYLVYDNDYIWCDWAKPREFNDGEKRGRSKSGAVKQEPKFFSNDRQFIAEFPALKPKTTPVQQLPVAGKPSQKKENELKLNGSKRSSEPIKKEVISKQADKIPKKKEDVKKERKFQVIVKELENKSHGSDFEFILSEADINKFIKPLADQQCTSHEE